MYHNYLSEDSAEHYAVAVTHDLNGILIQLGSSSGDQIRLRLTPEQATHFIDLLDKCLTTLDRKNT